MKVEIRVIADDDITPALARVQRGVKDRTRLNRFVAQQVAHVTRTHLRKEAQVRHKTADRLGARPTGHLERAAESVSFSGTDEGARIEIDSPGISRAFGDLEITAKNKYLTIPARAESYGVRARSFNDLKFIPLKKGTVPVLGRIVKTGGVGGKKSKRSVEVFYWLKPSVTVKQDRGLLPSDTEFLQACEDGAETFLFAELERRNTDRRT